MTNKFTYTPVFLTGLIDGIIVPLTIFSFFSRVLQQNDLALQITLAGGFTLAILLAIGAYYTRKAELESSEELKLLKIYANLGINETIQQQMAKDTIEEQQQWVQEWNEGENAALNLSPVNYALVVGGGYIAGLAIVLLSTAFINSPGLQFLILPLAMLAIAGFMKYKISSQNPYIGLLTVVISGAMAAISNWMVAGLF